MHLYSVKICKVQSLIIKLKFMYLLRLCNKFLHSINKKKKKNENVSEYLCESIELH